MIISLVLLVQTAPILRGNALPPPPPPAPRVTAPAKPAPTVKIVEIGGRNYRVSTLGMRLVEISGGDAAMQQSEALAKTFRTAAGKATGCVVQSDYWVRTILYGTLDCSRRVIP